MSVVDLDERRLKLGGSTIAAAVGIDPWTSPIRLWLEMTRGLAREESEPMRLGKRLEPVIFAELNDRGYPAVQTPGLELYDAAVPWLIGHPDGIGRGPFDGAIVEAKATGRPTDLPPVHHEAQVQTYMRLSGTSSAIVAQLGGLTFSIWEVEYHARLVDVLLHLGAMFMEYVRAGVQPPPNSHPDDRAALLAAYPDSVPGKKVRETREIRDARRELAGLIERARAWEARVEHLRALITDHMGDAEILVNATDDRVATWKSSRTRRLDTTKLKAQRPDIYDLYSHESTGRTLRLT